MHNSHRKHLNTLKNSETKVGNHRNPLPLWQACIYPTLGTGDLQCSPGFLPRSTEHSLGVCPQARTSPTHTSNTSQRISNFPLEERRNNRIAFCQNHMKRTAIYWWQKALQHRGRIWRKRRRRRIIRRRGSALCNRAAAQPRPSYPKPLQQEAHIMIPLVRLRGCIIHWMNILFFIHWQSVLSKRSLVTLWSLLCASMDLSFTGWRACSSPIDNPCCPSEAYFHLLRIMCFSFFLFFSS